MASLKEELMAIYARVSLDAVPPPVTPDGIEIDRRRLEIVWDWLKHINVGDALLFAAGKRCDAAVVFDTKCMIPTSCAENMYLQLKTDVNPRTKIATEDTNGRACLQDHGISARADELYALRSKFEIFVREMTRIDDLAVRIRGKDDKWWFEIAYNVDAWIKDAFTAANPSK